MVVFLCRPHPMAKLAMAERERRRNDGQKGQAYNQANASYRFVPHGPRGPCRSLKQKA